MVTGYRAGEIADVFAKEIADVIHQYGGGNLRLAIDRLDVPTALALQKTGLQLLDGKKF